MIRIQHFLTAGMLTAGLLLPTGLLAGADECGRQERGEEPSRPAWRSRRTAAPPKAAKPKRELSPELAALRDHVRQVLATHAEAAVQHPAELPHRNPERLPGLRLRHGSVAGGARRTAHQRHHLPLLELSVRRLRVARCRPAATSPRGSATAIRSIPASSWPCWPCRASRRTTRSASARRSARWPIWSRPRSSVAARAATCRCG